MVRDELGKWLQNHVIASSDVLKHFKSDKVAIRFYVNCQISEYTVYFYLNKFNSLRYSYRKYDHNTPSYESDFSESHIGPLFREMILEAELLSLEDLLESIQELSENVHDSDSVDIFNQIIIRKVHSS